MVSHWSDPHALYRIFDRNGTLLYVGCSYALCSRLGHHGVMQPWIHEVATIKVEWYHDEITGRRAEAAAILSECPKYNRLKIKPDAVGISGQAPLERRPRGDGTKCPRCGNPKEDTRVGRAYCNPCYREYQAARRLRSKAT
jgi:hypothetical protein